ncbi:MAG: four helix bundle protein [Candidatus Staskawiczbacteria bacterium RIFCSPHIGHO2_02_FULL_34_10]|uniref:Four helix bundle protein n=2 Tax=Candidatus Staskawicziibacteriota TaxID=1817916 RepID=A0A1G2HL19_9BACT|nr:MAG: four helix bundle protein [Candidatus Staskawiczbacteria bacterium RIFCSPHIGHO2_01_FULL_34_27]OGZ66633.1 MAG: four helix bundle protein [Candidatus Staskawiczbacteria bacterium RIFCSPHIGHO2_02_FULL_34_10]
MSEITNQPSGVPAGTAKPYDLEERTAQFAENCRDFVKKLPKTNSNFEYGKQLIRSSGSQAANYIEANESLGRRDFAMRIKICRKETKESCLWLRLSDTNNIPELEKERKVLMDEALQLRKIFTSILEKSKF